jgi:hypothetical protein
MKRLCAASVLVVSGCVAPTPEPAPTINLPIQADVLEKCSAKGTAKITGQAFMRTLGGDTKFAAGEPVLLYPRTEHAVLYAAYLDHPRRPDAPPELAKATRRTIADADGRFEFTDLPACVFLATTRVTWMRPSRYGLEPEGGRVNAHGETVAGQTLKLVLTR